jgi:hypothetical protein
LRQIRKARLEQLKAQGGAGGNKGGSGAGGGQQQAEQREYVSIPVFSMLFFIIAAKQS